MMFHALSICALAFVASAAIVRTRADDDTTELGSFYAYGQNLSGLPIFFNHAIAYIGYEASSNASTVANITFTEQSANSSLTVTPNNTVSLSASNFYINREAGAFSTAGFTNASTSSDSVTTTGFALYGSQLVWISDAGELEQKWWAVPTANKTNLYTLNWNVENVLSESAVPVVVKNKAPAST
ncbi:Hypothetical protein R9X50_00646200 [Acrodontium crateriforme]|uniref:Uncharacterized protein n=1 Tax=Acrodontium crateriforme TaxID=150365 RepID=A0AAQ3M973_9PEZI|nr:Hypothetical protein R9X50_00646200 [Acrodontium crateriforme]